MLVRTDSVLAVGLHAPDKMLSGCEGLFADMRESAYMAHLRHICTEDESAWGCE